MIPSLLNIIGKQVEVVVQEELEGALGESYVEQDRILIRAGQKKFNEADTLLHECIHFIDERFQTGLTERQVYCITVGLLNLIKDNPSLLEYVTDVVKYKREI